MCFVKSDLEYVQQDDAVSIQPGEVEEVIALCPEGKRALGGGFVNTSGADVIVTRSTPNATLTGWIVWFRNVGTSPRNSGAAYVVCASVCDCNCNGD